MTEVKRLMTWSSLKKSVGVNLSPNEEKKMNEIFDNEMTGFLGKMVAEAENGNTMDIIVKMRKALSEMERGLGKAISSNLPGKTDDFKDNVTKKFRGNVGEIIVGKMVEEGCFYTYDVDKDSYVCLNSGNENKEDAEVSSVVDPRIKMGIQVKNWSRKMDHEETVNTLLGALAAWSGRMFHTPIELFETFKRLPRQLVITFSDLDAYATKQVMETGDQDKMVCVIGPKRINELIGPNNSGFWKGIIDSLH